MVLLTPNLKEQHEVFNEEVMAGLRSLLNFDVAMAKRISVKLLCRSLIQKYQDDDIITKPFYCQTQQVHKCVKRVIIYNYGVIRSLLETRVISRVF